MSSWQSQKQKKIIYIILKADLSKDPLGQVATRIPQITGCGQMELVWFMKTGRDVNPMMRPRDIRVVVITWSGPEDNGRTEKIWKKIITFASMRKNLKEGKGAPQQLIELK